MFVFDIDGVLADVTHLLPLIDQALPKDKRDYDEYYRRIGEALPIEEALYMCSDILNADNSFIFITGRSERCKRQTLQWLNHNLQVDSEILSDDLYMRKDGDERPAHEVKKEVIKRFIDVCTEKNWPPLKFIVFEDDRRCVEMYKQLGCYVNHVKHDAARSS